MSLVHTNAAVRELYLPTRKHTPGLALHPRRHRASWPQLCSAAGKRKLSAGCLSLASPSAARSAPVAVERSCRAGFSMAVDWLGFGYAALVASGGIIGYAKAGSVPSLAAGLLFGSLAGLGAYQLSQNPNNVWISLITSGTLTAIMGTRFYNSGKFMPAGLIAGVSLLMVGRLALKMVEKPHDK
ncbi:transmembrane protein 14C-like isoform X1 [Pogoniulus pusillus]